MRSKRVRASLTLASLAIGMVACSHTSRVALMSNGDLAGRQLSAVPPGPVLTGADCGITHYLSKAFRKAIANTPYDTIVDATVTTTTGVFVFSNCVEVQGQGVRSIDLPVAAVTP